MKTTIIDLLNKIAKGEASETTNFKIWGQYYNISSLKKDYPFTAEILNWDIEIIEEEPKIPEKLEYIIHNDKEYPSKEKLVDKI